MSSLLSPKNNCLAPVHHPPLWVVHQLRVAGEKTAHSILLRNTLEIQTLGWTVSLEERSPSDRLPTNPITHTRTHARTLLTAPQLLFRMQCSSCVVCQLHHSKTVGQANPAMKKVPSNPLSQNVSTNVHCPDKTSPKLWTLSDVRTYQQVQPTLSTMIEGIWPVCVSETHNFEEARTPSKHSCRSLSIIFLPWRSYGCVYQVFSSPQPLFHNTGLILQLSTLLSTADVSAHVPWVETEVSTTALIFPNSVQLFPGRF